MTDQDLARLPGMRVVVAPEQPVTITGGYTSDLLSDVMAHARAGSALITIQAHRNTAAVAALGNLPAVIICNDRPIPDDLSAAARQEGLALLTTADDQFSVSHRVAALLESEG